MTKFNERYVDNWLALLLSICNDMTSEESLMAMEIAPEYANHVKMKCADMEDIIWK